MTAPGLATVDTGAGLARLREELLLATTALEVALALLGPLSDCVEDYPDQRLIVRHVARQWLALGPAAQQTYSSRSFPHAGVMWFAWDWFDQTNMEPFEGLGEHDNPSERDPAAVLHRHWQALVARLCEAPQ